MDLKTSNAFSKVSALKKTQAAVTVIKVLITAGIFHMRDLFPDPEALHILLLNGAKSISMICVIPCIAPHIMKLRVGPCQKPLIMNTMNIFIYLLTVPFLLPPRGIYIYLVSHLVRVICHLFQKSLTDTAV